MSIVPDPDVEALDAYSRIVTAVAADLTPHVAALEVTGRDGRSGAGSAVVVTADGLLLTNAHVVSRAARGRAVFSDGSEADVDVVGADPLSDLAVVRARTSTPPPATLGDAGSAPGRPAGRRRRQSPGADRLGDRGRGQRAGPVAAHARRAGGAGGRGRDPDRRRAQSGQLRRRAGRLLLPRRRDQHRGRGLGSRAGGADERHQPTDHRRRWWPTAACAGPTSGWSARPRRCRRRSPSAPAGGAGLRIVDIVPGSPADRSGLKAGDLVLEAGRRPVADAQSLQRLLFADAIGRPLPMTVHRRGAMVDVITVPTELTGA